MAIIHPFKALRPTKDLAHKVASLPYDVMSREEGREMAKGNDLSFLHVVRADIDHPDEVDQYDEKIYASSKAKLTQLEADGVLVQDKAPMLYIYRQIMDGHHQTGLVACASIDEYLNDTIKKHEKTREAKEQDRIRHFDTVDANTAPIFLTYRHVKAIDDIIDSYTKADKPEYDFTSEDNIQHQVWLVDKDEDVQKLVELFGEKVPALYIADGHHRAASAAKVGQKRRSEKGEDPKAEYNFFLAVIFPDKDLRIMDYNRVVKDLHGLTPEAFLEEVKKKFDVEEAPAGKPYRPTKVHTFGLYLAGKWYKLTAHPDLYEKEDEVGQLDVSILQNNLLAPVLGIGDPRVDERIDFVGGIRGLKELEKRCEEDMELAFSMYPTSIKQLMDIADASALMPPKSTWFEPKLRSGLFIHKLS